MLLDVVVIAALLSIFNVSVTTLVSTFLDINSFHVKTTTLKIRCHYPSFINGKNRGTKGLIGSETSIQKARQAPALTTVLCRETSYVK